VGAVIHDAGVREPGVRLAVLLPLLRIAAGRRGYASLTWHGAGFTYTLHTVRDPGANPATADVDEDIDDDGLLEADPADIVARLRELVEVQP
jgi:hypothetical protein